MKERKGKGPNSCLYVVFNLQGNAKLCVCDRVEKHIRVETRSVGQRVLTDRRKEDSARRIAERKRRPPQSTHYLLYYKLPPPSATSKPHHGRWWKESINQVVRQEFQVEKVTHPSRWRRRRRPKKRIWETFLSFFLSIVYCCVLFKPPYCTLTEEI